MVETRLPRPLRWCYLLLAYACVGLALVGVVVPGMPTTVFLLIAAWAASRGSERLHRWLQGHPRFGPLLRNWREQRAIPPGAKRSAILLLLVSWCVLAYTAQGRWVPAVAAIGFLALAVFLVSRPNPRPPSEDPEARARSRPR